MTFFVGKHGICECCNETGLAVVAAVSQAQEGGEDAGDDEDRQQDDEGRREGGSRHADVALQVRGSADCMVVSAVLPAPHEGSAGPPGTHPLPCHFRPL